MRHFLFLLPIFCFSACKPSPESVLLKKVETDIKTKIEATEKIKLDADCLVNISDNGQFDNPYFSFVDSAYPDEKLTPVKVVGGYKATVSGKFTEGALARHKFQAVYYCTRIDGKPSYAWQTHTIDIQ